jgi:GntR family transcriptional regulator
VRLTERDLYKYPLLRLLEERLGVKFGHAEQTIEARLANEDVAKALEIGFGDPVLFVERLMFGEDDRPLEVVRSYYRGDAYRYHMRLERSRTAPFRWRLSNGGRP